MFYNYSTDALSYFAVIQYPPMSCSSPPAVPLTMQFEHIPIFQINVAIEAVELWWRQCIAPATLPLNQQLSVQYQTLRIVLNLMQIPLLNSSGCACKCLPFPPTPCEQINCDSHSFSSIQRVLFALRHFYCKSHMH